MADRSNDGFPKTKIKIGLPTVIFFVFLIFSNFSLYSVMPFIAAALHELAHIWAMKMCGERVASATILPFGIDIKRYGSVSSYKADIFINSAGVSANVLLAVLANALPESPERNFFIMSNLALIGINILPIKSLDGGQVLEKLLLLRFSPETAERVVGIASFLSLLALWSVAIWTLFYTAYNFSLFLMCVYLFCGIFLKGQT